MRRRTFVTACGVTALAGCIGAGSDDSDNNDNESDGGPTGNESDGNDNTGGDSLGATDPDPTEFSGSGNATTDTFTVRPGLTVLDIEPMSGLRVDVIDSGGNVWRSLEGDIQNYKAFIPIDVPQGEYTMEIRTDREWSVSVVQPDVGDGDLVTPPATLTSSEPAYLGPIDFSDVNSVAINHTGVGEFSLKLYTLGGEYLGEIYADQGIFEADVSLDHGGQGWIVCAAVSDYEVTLETDDGETDSMLGAGGGGGGGNSSS
ncbi:hypothetical protein SAMN06269185_3022 [Natronoarchaeum philippinense]|uniref:Uncharacterized protein n=1 Tax=Natronoarchaeum philippinense TaxID=558529 RepID=A0A285P6S9_NATPI|nr:hypothetical protein [Natronoarchaeum philippinense]SNZ17435.1 hypothetical protein SAMN06269185_3022 [Natronoarchaeum philippinense]